MIKTVNRIARKTSKGLCWQLKMSSVDYVSLAKPHPVIGVCQMTCTADKQANFLMAKSLVERCKAMGAQMVFLPEACDYIATSKQESMDMAEPLQGETVSKYQQLARDLGIWMSLGGIHQKSSDSKKLLNTHVMLDHHGNIQGSYCKTHLFDLDIPGKVRLCESDYTIPGDKIGPPVNTPIGKVGLGICYDMRFPEMAVSLCNQGTELLTYPSAFTIPTGMAHWEVLLRNRAIESQCYVVAAAQVGKHNEKRSSYGHSMVVNPWGTVVAECPDGPSVCVAEIDLEYLQRIRAQMPVQQHRRHDLYGHIVSNTKEPIDSQEQYNFGGHQIGCGQVFFRSALSFAFVNIKPVVPGHVLIAPLRCAERFADLESAEVADLFSVVKIVSKVIEEHFKGTSLSIDIQDGPQAGQTVEHVHVHILPRKDKDFANNDDIYEKLQGHDDDLETLRQQGKLRSVEDMNQEAAELRQYFT